MDEVNERRNLPSMPNTARILATALVMSMAAPSTLTAAEEPAQSSDAPVTRVEVSIHCTPTRQLVEITNARRGAITIESVGTTAAPIDREPFRVDRRLRSDGRVTYAFGTGRGENRLARRPIIDFGMPDERLVITTDQGVVEVPVGRWCPVAMTSKRTLHTSTRLPDGRVLISGGSGGVGWAKPSTETWDPATGVLTETARMSAAREGHSATLLEDGRVLMAGGLGKRTGTLDSAELYDPGRDRFRSTGRMTRPRSGHTATLLDDGRVLIVGGPRIAELYDPETGSFDPTGRTTVRRVDHAATRLADGRVLITGGEGDLATRDSAELFDPGSGTFTAVGPMTMARAVHTSIRLDDGRVLIIGGSGDTERRVEGFDSGAYGIWELAAAEVFDPATGTFEPREPDADPTRARDRDPPARWPRPRRRRLRRQYRHVSLGRGLRPDDEHVLSGTRHDEHPLLPHGHAPR